MDTLIRYDVSYGAILPFFAETRRFEGRVIRTKERKSYIEVTVCTDKPLAQGTALQISDGDNLHDCGTRGRAQSSRLTVLQLSNQLVNSHTIGR